MAGEDDRARSALASMRVTGRVPAPARLGRARLRRWTVSPAEARAAERLQRLWSPFAEGPPLPAGDHTVLLVDGAFSMADAPFVLRNYVPFLEAAAGDVLLTGLGLGCLLRGLLAKPEVSSITVLELHRDVLELVGPYHRDARVELVHADALRWEPAPGRHWDVAMLDIADDRDLVERLVARHIRWADALWPNPAEMLNRPRAREHLSRAAVGAARADGPPGLRSSGSAPSGPRTRPR
jgi:hypothetical protein